MRYVIRKPIAGTFDPRTVHFRDLEHMNEHLPVVSGDEYTQQFVVARRMFAEYPDGLPMPAPVSIGSSQIVMMGMLEHSIGEAIPTTDTIPLVALVCPIAERMREREQIVGAAHWDTDAWRAPVRRPSSVDARILRAEIRATDLRHPTVVNAVVGTIDGDRTVLYLELAGIEMSVMLVDSNVRIVGP